MPTNPRPNAKIDVKLIETEQVKVHNNITVSSIYSAILKSQDLYTINIEEYKKSLVPGIEDKNKAAENTPRVPKYFIVSSDLGPTITLIGNAIIATPTTPGFNEFPATLSSDNGQFYDTVEQSSGDWGGNSEGQSSIRIAGRSGNTLGKEADAGGVALSFGSGAGAGAQTFSSSRDKTSAFCNSWEGDGFEERIDGIFSTRKDLISKTITSDFQLGVNQPFSMKFKLFDFTPEQQAVLRAGSSTASNSVVGLGTSGAAQKNNKVFHKLIPSVDIYWGGNLFRLTYYQDGRVALFFGQVQIGQTQTLPMRNVDKTNGVQITVYPLGNFIYIYSGVPTTEATLNNWYAKFNLKEPVIANAGSLFLDFSCGECHFNFSPVVHPASGEITSPLLHTDFEPSNIINSISYIGKFGVGARDNPIKFPDVNDKDKIYSYLENQVGISYSLDKQATGVYTYTLSLDVANNVQGFKDLRDQVETALATIQKMAAQEYLAVKNNARTISQANANMAAHINQAFTNPFTGAKILDGQIWGDGIMNHTLDSSGAYDFNPNTQIPIFSDRPIGTIINGVKANMAQEILSFFGDTPGSPGSGIFGGGSSNDTKTALNFGGQMASALSKASKSIKNSLHKQEIKAVGRNIYSPAVFMSQLTFVSGLETVSLSPNPQIDNCDVMEITVNSAVEHTQATVILNNRNVCATTGKGTYTYVKGSNNFTGIKPIKIQLGYQGEFGDMELKQVFSGYIHKRRYIRSGSNSSQCVLECEDRSKKAKEQFAVNLPFFDGWCHLGAFYYLAKEAGFSDDEILLYQDPVTGAKQRIRDLLVGDPDTFTGGCFDGHVNENPPGIAGLDGSYLHATLPLVLLGSQENVNYNFSFGTPLWTCMMRIREFLNFYLYCNNLGNLIYGPPPLIIKDSGVTFKEVDTVGDFNEIQKRLEVSFDTAYTRNMVFLQGQKFVPNKDPNGFGTWVPHIHIRRKSNFPNDIGDTSYAPWIRYAFIRNPKIESDALGNYAANEMFRRYTRTVANCDFSGWGHPQLFPYQAITIDESILNETGASSLSKFVIAAHTLRASTSDFQLSSDFSVETYDPISVNYEPNLTHLRE